MVKEKNNEYQHQVGEMVIGLLCPSPLYADSMQEYFGFKNAIAEPNIQIKLNVVPHDDEPEIPDSCFTTKTISPEGFNVSDNLIRGKFIPKKHIGEIFVKKSMTKGSSTRIFEQLLYQAFYSARKIANYDAFLIHSSGVIHDGAGFLFVGASGSGKSTVARLSLGKCVLNDEVDLVSFRNGQVYLHGTPFNGYFKEKSEGNAPLKAILFLKQGDRHGLCKISRGVATSIIFREIVPPIGLEEELSRETRLTMLELAERLSSCVPLRWLEFKPEQGFWKEIIKEFL